MRTGEEAKVSQGACCAHTHGQGTTAWPYGSRQYAACLPALLNAPAPLSLPHCPALLPAHMVHDLQGGLVVHILGGSSPVNISAHNCSIDL